MHKQKMSSNQFVEYYIKQSMSATAQQRSESIMHKILMMRKNHGHKLEKLDVADIGCNAGTQSMMWAEKSHNVSGIDIVEELVEIAKTRAEEKALEIHFTVGSATALPWGSESADVCILPELLEHVTDWERCLEEAARILRPNGTLYLSTTNVLCPKQEEFDLPLYSWYPKFLKKRLEKLSVTTRRHWVSYTEYPAVNWFSYYRLKRHLEKYGFICRDRFDMIIESGQRGISRSIAKLIVSNRLFRFIGHIFTPYTVVFAEKSL